MKLLLPYRFKKAGLLMAPAGLLFWILMQRGLVTRALIWVLGTPVPREGYPPYHSANVAFAIIGFFSFLGGLYFIAFSKEKVEDEMISQVRLESFQFASALQLLAIIGGFVAILLYGEPEKEGMMNFFICSILLFWIFFITRFNYVIHVKLRNEKLY
ncbi:hypothetical protein [Flaviaesturariibacter amylovorans]|uniref:DUF2178 domain-containing protein n=1 Tax=Flaviaesturariibacter amylovorans TaxID=1084520 RepID=A0ABP8G3N9_9BACT